LLGLSQAELAQRTGVTTLTVRQYAPEKTGLATERGMPFGPRWRRAAFCFLIEDDDGGRSVRLKKARGPK
jgi:hypothetical protein